MITRLVIENFKRFSDRQEIELGSPVVFVGRNNSGKTSALQALALWEVAVRRWFEKRRGQVTRGVQRTGVSIPLTDVIFAPVRDSQSYWHGLHVRRGLKREGRPATGNIRMNILVDGTTRGQPWTCGFEFDYQGENTILCRPLRKAGFENVPVAMAEFTEVPALAENTQVALLPAMSGLRVQEEKLTPGSIRRAIGEGRTADVLRNLCHALLEEPQGAAGQPPARWQKVAEVLSELFGVTLNVPEFVTSTGELRMTYVDDHGVTLDLALAGRGMLQTLLLFAYLHANPGAVLLLDEPDAHLETLRQRQIYNRLTQTAAELGCQLIVASHSEVVLNEAAARDVIIGFGGARVRRVNDRGTQLLKSLTTIGFEKYLQAEQKGWVLFLEGPSDLAVLQAFARLKKHKAELHLDHVFVDYLSTNLPQLARDVFHGLAEAVPDLRGLAIFDRLDKRLQSGGDLREVMWQRREIENYLCTSEVLLAYAGRGLDPGDLFSRPEAERRRKAMQDSIAEIEASFITLGRPAPWSDECKVSDDFLTPLFRNFYKRLGLFNPMNKASFYQLVPFMDARQVPDEVIEKLDAIAAVAEGDASRVLDP